MATSTFAFLAPSGQTLTVKWYTRKTDTQVASVSATERTNNKTRYTCSIVDVASGTYEWRAHTSAGVTLTSGTVVHTNATGVEYDVSETTASDLASEVWEHDQRTLTQSAASVAATLQGSTITVKRGDTISISITGLGSLANRSKLWFTVKDQFSDTDADSILQVEETANLIVFNGDDPADDELATLEVDDEDDGDVTITILPAASEDLTVRANRIWDIQILTSSGTVTTLTQGTFNVIHDVTITRS